MPSRLKNPGKFSRDKKDRYNQYANYLEEEDGSPNKATKQSEYRRRNSQVSQDQWH